MNSTKLLWQERESDSNFIESVWACRVLESTSRVVIADPCICISLVKSKSSTEIVIAGPKTHSRLQALPSGYSCITIRLKSGVCLKNLQTSKLVDDTISVPADDKAIFALDGATLRFPDFERAEQLIEKLFATGQLSFTQPQYIPTQPRRTRSRQIKDLTGISPYKLRQLQRIHRALRLLKQGSTTADVIAELAFTDQAHLTHVSKHLLGYTPKHLKDLLQNP